MKSKSYVEVLKSSKIVNFQIISHAILAIFYTFCILLVIFTSVETESAMIQQVAGPLVLIYLIIIVTLVKSAIGFYDFNPNTRMLSFIGLIVASAHQLFLINYLQTSYKITLSILYVVLLLEIILLFNLYFNRKITLLLEYISNARTSTKLPEENITEHI